LLLSTGRAVRADRDEERVAEGEEARVAEEQVEAQERDRVRERRQQQRHVVRCRELGNAANATTRR
jgi:hypothetical protein